MKVMWFTNIPMPAMDRHAGKKTQGSGHWMIALLAHLSRSAGIRLAVVCAYPQWDSAAFTEEGIDYYVVGQSAKNWNSDYGPEDLKQCTDIVTQWQPDIIHIHGTERFYGLLTSQHELRCPVVLSIQGFVNPLSKWHIYFGNLSIMDILRCHGIREFVFRSGLLMNYRAFLSKANQEKTIIDANQFFMGRTDWDRAHLASMNPQARYFHVEEMMRDVFFTRTWDASRCKPRSIVSTNAGNPMRGTEILLHAIALLCKEFPDIELKLAGNISFTSGYGRSLLRLIERLELGPHVRFLGYLDEKTLADELSTSHAFAIASYLENSPNSLCEAMLMGMPCVASDVGGIPSLLTHESEGLLFPPGDAPLLASNLKRIFTDEVFSRQLGAAARDRAMKRHDPANVLRQLLATYEEIVLCARRVSDECNG